jgi:structural maintenance of chromosome 2
MRPQEILGMVEEAAGTRMFEERKDKAKKTMSKKEKKVEELTSLLKEEITPKLDNLREDKRAFLRFQKNGTDLERLARVLRAYDWYAANQKLETKANEAQEKQQEGKRLEKEKKKLAQEIQHAERDIEQTTAQRDRELKKGGRYKQLEEQVAEMEKTLVKVRTQVEIKQDGIKSEEAKLDKLEEERKEVRDTDLPESR